MDVLKLDIPLLAIGLALVVWLRLSSRLSRFHVAVQVVSTFWAQISYIVTLSLGRLLPILALSGLRRGVKPHTGAFAPFFAYAFAATLFLSVGWQVPPFVNPVYGEYRVYLQLFNLTVTSAAAIGFAQSLVVERRMPRLYFDALTLVALVHGLASVYHLAAAQLGLPVIGISRAHMADMDIAAFYNEEGRTVLRPGGLAGEPKSAAIVFGLYILMWIFARPQRATSLLRSGLEWAALMLSTFGFLAAFSTSGFVGLGASLLVLLPRLRHVMSTATVRVTVVVGLAVAGWLLAGTGGFDELAELLRIRTVERLSDSSTAIDMPIAASLEAMQDDPVMMLFGTGLGGSSFIVMRYLGYSVDFAYMPNVGFMLVFIELGIVGLLLLCVPVLRLMLMPLPAPEDPDAERARLCFVTGVSAFFLNMSNTPLALGVPLAVASLSVFGHLSRAAAARARGQAASARRVPAAVGRAPGPALRGPA